MAPSWPWEASQVIESIFGRSCLKAVQTSSVTMMGSASLRDAPNTPLTRVLCVRSHTIWWMISASFRIALEHQTGNAQSATMVIYRPQLAPAVGPLTIVQIMTGIIARHAKEVSIWMLARINVFPLYQVAYIETEHARPAQMVICSTEEHALKLILTV